MIATCPSSFVCHSSCVINFLAYVRSRGHIFSHIIVKLGQNVCLDKIFDEFENRLCQVKNKWVRILEKLYVHSKGHIFSTIIMKRGQNVCLDKISEKFRMGHVGSKIRSLGHM